MRSHRHRSAAAFVLSLALAACAPHAAPVAATGLAGSAWVLEDLAGAAVLESVRPTISFSEAGTVSGNAWCNRFSGNVTVKGDSMTFGALAATRMACEPAVDAQETAYLRALQSAERYTVDGSKLSIFCTGMDKPLRFKRAKGA